MVWLSANIAWILATIVALDTALAQIPALKSNSTFQLVSGWVVSIAAFFGPKQLK